MRSEIDLINSDVPKTSLFHYWKLLVEFELNLLPFDFGPMKNVGDPSGSPVKNEPSFSSLLQIWIILGLVEF